MPFPLNAVRQQRDKILEKCAKHPETLKVAPELGRVDELLRGQVAGPRGRDEFGHVVEVDHPRSRRAQADCALEDLPRRLGMADLVRKYQPPEFLEKSVVAAHVIEMQGISIG